MVLEKQPFRKYNLDDNSKKRDIFSVSLNEGEREEFELDKKALHQLKDGTAMKQLWRIARKVLHSNPEGEILKIVLENNRKNKDRGIYDFD